jgi:hypothetical protein
MNARGLWKIFRLNFKMMYSRWFLVFIAFSFAVFFVASVSAIGTEDYASLFPNLGVLALLLAGGSGFLRVVKSEVDFVFSTPVNPLVVYIAKTATSAVLSLFLFGAFTVYLPRPDVISHVEYAASLLFNTAFFALMAGASSLVSIRRWILYTASQMAVAAVTIVKPELSPLYGLVYPSPFYVAYSGAAAALAFLATPRNLLKELATNAYGVFAPRRPAGDGDAERVVGPARIGPTPWRAVWTTSVNGVLRMRSGGPEGVVVRRVNVLKIYLLLSAAAAAVYYVLLRLLPEVGFLNASEANFLVTLLSFYLLLLVFMTSAGADLDRERLWLSLAVEPARYFRLRMFAKAVIAAVLLAPWAAVYFLVSLSFPPAARLAPAVAALALTLPAASWLTAAYSGWPQIRDLELPQSLFRFTLRGVLTAFLYLLFVAGLSAPYILCVASMDIPALAPLLLLAADVVSVASLALSAAFFYLTTYSPWAPSIWGWFVNKLSEDGYV